MKFSSRRFFIKNIAASTAALVIGPDVLAISSDRFNDDVAWQQKDMNDRRNFKKFSSSIDPIIPFEFYPAFEDEMLADIISLRNQYGFRRFLLTGPSKESRYTGFPQKQVFSDLGELVLRVKKRLTSYDIEIGWWCATTIRIGKGSFQSIVKADGSIANEACCPLDLDFRKVFSDYIATVVEIARPFWINFEDDYQLSGGCYCPYHLEEFGRRQNHNYSRDELLIAIADKTPEAKKLRQAWDELKRDSLAGLADSVRSKVDQIAPETRLCLCQSGNSERDGNFTNAVTLAFAGTTRPAVRVYGTSYFSDSALDIPQAVFNALYQRQHLPANFEIIHESDTFPHTRFFMSASKLKSLMMAAFAYGLDDSLFYATQYLENPLEEKGYLDMFLKESVRFSALKAAVKDCNIGGCEIFRKPTTSSNWIYVMGRHGIPYTSVEGNVKLVSGNIIESMAKREIVQLLKGSVFLDGHAAYLLHKRGFGKMIGGEITYREKTVLPPFFEAIRNPEKYQNINNRLMYNYLWAFNQKNPESFYQIRPLPAAEVITDFIDSKNKPSSPGMIRFENELGGRIAIMAFNLDDNYVCTRSISIFNYSKKEIIRQIIEWLSKNPLPVFVKQIPNTFCIFNRSKSNDYAVAVIIGLSSDSFDSFSLDVAPEWINSQFKLLNQNGEWVRAQIEKKDRTIKINTKLSLMDPVILMLTK